jgi:hypothetical protein
MDDSKSDHHCFGSMTTTIEEKEVNRSKQLARFLMMHDDCVGTISHDSTGKHHARCCDRTATDGATRSLSRTYYCASCKQ